MSDEDDEARDPVKPDTCVVCEAYAHPFLTSCPFCGAPRKSLFDLAAQVHAAAFEERDWNAADAEAFLRLTEELDGHGYLPDFRQSQVESLRRHTARRIWAEIRQKSARKPDRAMDQLSRGSISAIGLRYEGGLPALPAGADVTATVEKNAVTMTDPRSGALLAQVPLGHILGIQAFPTKSALLDGWVGLSFGGAAYFTSPTVSGGNLVIVNAQGGQAVQWALGNRSGMFTRKADYTGFCMMRFGLTMGASRAARRGLGGADPTDYARDLGFRVPDAQAAAASTAATTPALPNDVASAMRQLNALRDEGLITQDEYDDKRAGVLGRL